MSYSTTFAKPATIYVTVDVTRVDKITDVTDYRVEDGSLAFYNHAGDWLISYSLASVGSWSTVQPNLARP